MSSRISVTGATGFVGGHLCRRLVAEGHRVKALVRRRSQEQALRD
ncbi:MAG: NAD-dependent epimerase/dehydratase family protein, partial [bacterium]|nr:NAD-dependent epimerase/dehydratase family protein [bacterium]